MKQGLLSTTPAMLPIRDKNPSQTFPYVTYSLVAVNVVVFLFELTLQYSGQLDAFLTNWSMIPEKVMAGKATITILTSMFLHGGIMHIFGNMLYLAIFGNNVEDVFGHAKFHVFYLFCGVSATILYILLGADPSVPTLGASGAIAGVLGAYLVLFPRAKVDTLVFAYFITWVTIPAAVLLGFWFVLQLFSGVLSIGTYASSDVAYFAHIGGFAAGALIALPLRSRVTPRRERSPVLDFQRRDDYYWR